MTLLRRRVLFALAVVLWWGLLVLAFLPAPFGSPWSPAQVVTLDGRDFQPVLGRATATDRGLEVTATSVDLGALQVIATAPFDAAAHPILRYRFDSLPRTLELTFVFRRQDDPDNVHPVTLATVARSDGTLDLSGVPEWRGNIVEVGFAQFPGAQSVPPAVAFRPFTLVSAALASPSWRDAIAARTQDWFGPRSWALMSLSALGPDSTVPGGTSLVTLVFLGGAGTLLLAAGLLGWRGRAAGRGALVVALLAWVLLDLRWLHGLHARHAVTRAVYDGLPAAERQRLLPDQELHDSAQMVRRVLAPLGDRRRVFVDAGSDFQRARLYYHLLPLNVAPVNLVGYGTPEQRRGAIVVLYNVAQPAPSATSKTGDLLFADGPMPATVLFELGALRVYQLAGDPP